MQAAFDDTAVVVFSPCDLNVKEVGETERVYYMRYVTSAGQTRPRWKNSSPPHLGACLVWVAGTTLVLLTCSLASLIIFLLENSNIKAGTVPFHHVMYNKIYNIFTLVAYEHAHSISLYVLKLQISVIKYSPLHPSFYSNRWVIFFITLTGCCRFFHIPQEVLKWCFL